MTSGQIHVPHDHGHLILFDGVCNLCNASIRFIINRDHRRLFTFAPIQSTTGQLQVQLHGLAPGALDTLILIDHGNVYTRSTAVLKIARLLNAPWPLFYGLILIPEGLRDRLYAVVARNRYRLWGRLETCMTASPDIQSRFLT